MQKIEKVFNFAGEEVKISMGHFGFRADVALMAQMGETVVSVFVTVDQQDAGLDYFPLGINYMEKFYAAGMISGSRFIKRERRPSDAAVIKGRIIDRGMRPLFPKDFKRAVSVVINVMSYDGVNDPAILGANAASLAVHLSSVPYAGPCVFVRVGMDQAGEHLMIDPNLQQMEESPLNAVIAVAKGNITQLEIDGSEVSNTHMAEAFKAAVEEAKAWETVANELKAELGKEKIVVEDTEESKELVEFARSGFFDEIKAAIFDDENRNNLLEALYVKVEDAYVDAQEAKGVHIDEIDVHSRDIQEAVKKIEKEITREHLLKDVRPSGRGMDEIRELGIEPQMLPRVHGSAMFRRGVTQALAITTLGSLRLQQVNEGLDGETEQRYMHHYVGPNYSFGSAGRFSFYPGNREIGHGMLAEKAVEPMLPSIEEFPYTIRVVSEILSQNGSTSMAATCASCLALMDAGVPIKRAVAGISVGLITSDESQAGYKLLTDVQDIEDFYGDMDFKVCGTRNGITAIQMDTKLKGVKPEILIDALDRAEKARFVILDKYDEVLPEPRKELSAHAPRVETVKIPTDKIGELIGPGGKTIKGILEDVNNEGDIDIQDDGTVIITAVNLEVITKLKTRVEDMTREPEVGEEYEGEVVNLQSFGMFVDIFPGTSGLVHVSEVSNSFVKDVSEFFKVGDKVRVKLLAIDDQGKIKLSMKAVKGFVDPIKKEDSPKS